MKKCHLCNEEKPLNDFCFRKDFNKHVNRCKECLNEQTKNERKLNGEKIRERDRRYYKENVKRINEKNKRSHDKNILRYKENQKQYYLKNKEYLLPKALKWQKDNREKRNLYFRGRRANDINFRLRSYLSSRISTVLKKNIKSAKTEILVGCTMDFLKGYLEGKFQKGMTWKNQGSWHIDHIIPCISFDLSKKEEQRQCFHYTNLQPLWAKDNFSKQAKIIEGTQMKIAI